jgi:hypothetical protein
MHPCKICGALYCDAECAVLDWRNGGKTLAGDADANAGAATPHSHSHSHSHSHRDCCLAGRAATFAADVKYALKEGERVIYYVRDPETCQSCDFASDASPLSRAADPRLRSLGIAPIEVWRRCSAHATPALLAAHSPAECVEARITRERAEIFECYKEFARKGAFKHDCPADAALVRRLWHVCRLLHNMIARTPRNNWDDTIDELARTLRSWARAGCAGARCAGGGCAPEVAHPHPRTQKRDLWDAFIATRESASTDAAGHPEAAPAAVEDLHTAFIVLAELVGSDQ